MTRSSRPTVAVIGGGFSGLMTAIHLLREPGGPCVRLIERRDVFARGAAYGVDQDDHLLNVRAGNMSAFPAQPDHFTSWLAAKRPAAGSTSFVSRACYGDYLQDLLREATRGEAGRLILDQDEAISVAVDEAGFSVGLAIGRQVRVQAVVVAVGNLPPTFPPGVDASVAQHPGYVADPWSSELQRLPRAGTAVLLGTGLTMVDVALRLERERPELRLLALSRRGLPPRRHLVEGPVPSPWVPAMSAPAPVLREARRRAKDEEWRSVVDGLRPHVQALWGGWSEAERSRFLRHLRPWWDVHRHRIAPPVAFRLDHLISSGRLRIRRGRLARVTPAADMLDVMWTTPTGEAKGLAATALVNCTGPTGDLARADDPLLRSLADDGLIRADAQRLGLDADPRGRLLDGFGRADRGLYGVGPVTRGALWEITSVPDIRVQAQTCAREIIESLKTAAA